MIRRVKQEIRVLGIDDAPFGREDESVLLVGTVFRAGRFIDGVLSTVIEKDGTDATEKIVDLFNKTGHKDQVRVILLNGITVGGFNTIDVEELCRKTKTPVIVVVRDKPDFDSIQKALKNFPDGEGRWQLVKRAGEVQSLVINGKQLYFQFVGLPIKQAQEILKLVCVHSNYPEPLRVAHMIGAGVVLGKTRGGR